MRISWTEGARRPARWLVLLLAGGLGGVLRAQGVPVIAVETHLVDSTLSVHDAQGRLARGLGREEFSVTEDGVPQKIRFFAHDAELPLSLGLVIDESGSQEKFVKEHEKAIGEFLQQVLGPKDEAFAVCFGNHLRLVSDVTSLPAAIFAGVHDFDHGKGGFPEIGPKEERDLGTALLDAVFYSVTEKLAGVRQRRKVLLVFSDGEENSSGHDLLDAIEAAQDANVLVYAIRYTELHHGAMNVRDRYGVRVLDHLTGQTGGRVYDSQAVALKAAFEEIAGELRSLYEVAYQSTNHVRDGSYRKVVITANRPGVEVRSRAGYYAR